MSVQGEETLDEDTWQPMLAAAMKAHVPTWPLVLLFKEAPDEERQHTVHGAVRGTDAEGQGMTNKEVKRRQKAQKRQAQRAEKEAKKRNKCLRG